MSDPSQLAELDALFPDEEPRPCYEVNTYAAHWAFVDDPDSLDTHDDALAFALARAAYWPQYCTQVELSDLQGGASLIWTSRPDPDQDPAIPPPPPRGTPTPVFYPPDRPARP